MKDHRKLVMVAQGLVYLIGLAALQVWGGLPVEGVETLSWAGFAVVATGLGSNVGEHFAKRPRKEAV